MMSQANRRFICRPATQPLLLVYSKGISAYLEDQPEQWNTVAELCPLGTQRMHEVDLQTAET